MISPVRGFKRVLEVFHRLHIPYMVGGSLASSIHGIARSTQDIDLIADVQPQHIEPLAADLSGKFYADPEMMRQALRTHRAFNLIHHESGYKFDVYPLSHDPYHQTAFERRATAEYSLYGETLRFYVSSPEDTILSKLAWYREGHQVSERQWSDVVDVVRVKRNELDLPYLRQWAQSLEVTDLLEQALLTPDS